MKANAVTLKKICAATVLLVVLAGCGGSSGAADQGPVTVTVVVTDAQVSADGQRVESITVLLDEGKERTMRLGDAIDPEIWGPPHILTHAGLGKEFGFKIGVTYIETPESLVVIELAE